MKGWRAQGEQRRGQEMAKASGEGLFDEVVAGDWLHVELMDARGGSASYFMVVGSRAFWLRVKKGKVEITAYEDRDETGQNPYPKTTWPRGSFGPHR
jgi:hypothetical protein